MFIKRIPGEQSPAGPEHLSSANGVGPTPPTRPARLSDEILSRIREAIGNSPGEKGERPVQRAEKPS